MKYKVTNRRNAYLVWIGRHMHKITTLQTMTIVFLFKGNGITELSKSAQLNTSYIIWTLGCSYGHNRKTEAFDFYMQQSLLICSVLHTMNFSVSIQASPCYKILTADITLIGSQSCVVTFVDGEGRQLCKALPTFITTVWTFTSMCPFVNA